jgi:trypsin-like peptidase
MFREAYAKAKHYTKPVVGVARTVNGHCTSGIASFVVINREGWILTAYHTLKTFMAIREIQLRTQSYFESLASIRAEAALSPKEAKAKIKALGSAPAPKDVQHCAVWWGSNEAKLVDAGGLEEIDLGIGRLDPFDPASVAVYPVIKNTSKHYEPGTSLCKLGYPFYDVPITWDTATNRFASPAGALSFPLFPIEGIFTRTVRDPSLAGKQPYNLSQFETSSPGLRGQSGGPIFDTKGRLWGIQTVTVHLPLGFQPEFEGKYGKKQRQHQFLNVGRGVHGETMIGLLNQLGVKFELSDD